MNITNFRISTILSPPRRSRVIISVSQSINNFWQFAFVDLSRGEICRLEVWSKILVNFTVEFGKFSSPANLHLYPQDHIPDSKIQQLDNPTKEEESAKFTCTERCTSLHYFQRKLRSKGDVEFFSRFVLPPIVRFLHIHDKLDIDHMQIESPAKRVPLVHPILRMVVNIKLLKLKYKLTQISKKQSFS